MKGKKQVLLPFVSYQAVRSFFLQVAMLCLVMAVSFPSFGLPSNEQSHDELKINVMRFVKQQFSAEFKVQTRVGKIDPRLRLAACTDKVESFYPVGARKLGPTNVGVRCQGEKPWTIYLPVNIKVYGEAVVSKRALPRGTILHPGDLTLAKRELSRATNGYYIDIQQLVGMSLRRSLARGSILQPKIVKQRHLVKRGDLITILAESNSVTIRVKGKAMMDGFRGQSIRIKNFRSKRELQGEVVAPGTVRINL